MEANIICSLIKDIDRYSAHIQCDEELKSIKRESLQQHVDLTLKYFKRVWKEKRCDNMLERFCQGIFPNASEKAKEFWKESIFAIPIFHDLGKINPEFQSRIMHNENEEGSYVFSCVGARHSMISSIVYLDYYLQQLREKEITIEEKKRLREFLLFHAYVIERHHSDLNEFEKYRQSLEKGAGYDIIEVFRNGKCKNWLPHFSLNEKKISHLLRELQNDNGKISMQTNIAKYTYVKALYSLLVASDYYATTEFMSGVAIKKLGEIEEIKKWIDIYEDTELMRKIRKYPKSGPKQGDGINNLRTEMLYDAEKILHNNYKESIFYLEAPTGSGKSNIALDLSFQLLRKDESLRKIYYIYPFNTLVEQNLQSLKKVFGNVSEIFDAIAVVNSLTPIKMIQKEKEKESNIEQTMYYQKALLDRQFLNYPMILSTHVSLFDTMFGVAKESVFGFHQLMNSVIVLDEIQSYKNTIWGEIIHFLKEFSYLLNIRIIIMSATLPNLDVLASNVQGGVCLMQNRDKYFSDKLFKNRVHISCELLNIDNVEENLIAHIKSNLIENRKILIEFIKKDSAYRFYKQLTESEEIQCKVEYMSGDDSLMERKRILEFIKETKQAVILVATQVIEAGVDIDMDIGYKNISKLDSEEQFLGRINRSCLRKGMAYFFKLDDAKRVYGEDVRMNPEFTLENAEVQKYLINKNFHDYYEQILNVLKRNYNEQIGERGLHDFFNNKVGKLNWEKVHERMQLISEDRWSMSVYLARSMEDEKGGRIDGRALWQAYISLLNDFQMNYAEKRIKLSQITSQMNYFIYQIRKNDNLIYNDKVGELFYIEDGEKFFDAGKLNRKKLQGEIGEFIDFI